MQLNPDKAEKYLYRAYRSCLSTLKQYMRCLHNYRSKYETVTQENVNDFLVVWANNPLNRAFLKALLKGHNITSITVERPRTRQKKRTDRIMNYFTKKEIDGMSQRLPAKLGLMVQLQFEAGLRRSEIMNLDYCDILLEERRVKGIGKGGKPFSELISQKTSILLHDFIKLARPNCKNYPFHWAGVTNQPKKYWYELKKECKKIGMENFKTHDIKHSLGNHLHNVLGWPLGMVSVKLKHSDISTTQIYTKADKQVVEGKMVAEVFGD